MLKWMRNPTAELVSRVALAWMDNKPFSEEGRARRKARRDAKRHRRTDRGQTVPEQVEVSLPKNDQVKVVFPDGTEGTRTEPTLNFRSSTKSGWAGIGGIVATMATLAPFYPQIEDFLMQACSSEQGPLRFLIILVVGSAASSIPQYITSRMTKTPMALSAKPPPN
jgi:hypothetical protein